MKKVRTTHASICFLCACALPSTASAQQVLDQSQTRYNGGTSARTLPGYHEWQSFTAGMTGTLSEVDMGFFAGINASGGTQMSGVGTLNIYAGNGTGGTLLQSEAVNVWAQSSASYAPVCWNLWTTNVNSVAGQMYTFDFTPGAGIPDPYGVCVGTIDNGGVFTAPYTGGNYDGGTQFSMNFKTWVTPAPEPASILAIGGLVGGLVRRSGRRRSKVSR